MTETDSFDLTTDFSSLILGLIRENRRAHCGSASAMTGAGGLPAGLQAYSIIPATRQNAVYHTFPIACARVRSGRRFRGVRETFTGRRCLSLVPAFARGWRRSMLDLPPEIAAVCAPLFDA